MLIGGIGTAIGTILKLFSIQTDLFWLVLTCQAILAATQTLIISLPPKIAAVWFGPNQVSSPPAFISHFSHKLSLQVSTACALGIFGSQLGIALGFIVPPVLIKNHDRLQDIGDDLYFLTCLLAAVITVVVVAIILCIR